MNGIFDKKLAHNIRIAENTEDYDRAVERINTFLGQGDPDRPLQFLGRCATQLNFIGIYEGRRFLERILGGDAEEAGRALSRSLECYMWRCKIVHIGGRALRANDLAILSGLAFAYSYAGIVVDTDVVRIVRDASFSDISDDCALGYFDAARRETGNRERERVEGVWSFLFDDTPMEDKISRAFAIRSRQLTQDSESGTCPLFRWSPFDMVPFELLLYAQRNLLDEFDYPMSGKYPYPENIGTGVPF